MAWKGVITNVGSKLVEQWYAGTTLHITAAKTGAGCVEDVALLAQTDLVSAKQMASIVSGTQSAEGYKVKLQITASEIGYKLNQYGIWASLDDSEESFLLALFQNPDGITVPSKNEFPDFVYTFYALLSVENTGEVELSIDPTALVTYDTVQEMLTDKADLVNGKVPVGQLPELDFDPSGSAAAVQELLTSHTENQENPHSVTADQIGAVPVTRTINGLPLSGNITLTPEEIGVTAKRTCTYVIGTSTAGWTAADCDHLCDGVDDQVEIQAAVDAIPANGGQIIILSGSYNLTDKIIVNSNTTVKGFGVATNLTFTMIATPSAPSAIELKTNCILRDLKVTWNPPSVESGVRASVIKMSEVYGITYNIWANTSKSIIGITVAGSYSKALYCRVSGAQTGILVGKYNTSGSVSPISHNLIEANGISVSSVANTRGIDMISAKFTCVSENVISGGDYCIRLQSSGSEKNKIAGNLCISPKSFGIAIYGSPKNLIDGNCVFSASDPMTAKSILVSGSSGTYVSQYNLISNNYIYGSNYTNEAGSTNTFVNNKYN